MTRSERVQINAQGTDDPHPLVKFAVSSPLLTFDFRINQFRGQMHLYRAKQNPKQSSANVKADGKVSVFMMILGSPIGINGQIHRNICLLCFLLSAEQTKKLFCLHIFFDRTAIQGVVIVCNVTIVKRFAPNEFGYFVRDVLLADELAQPTALRETGVDHGSGEGEGKNAQEGSEESHRWWDEGCDKYILKLLSDGRFGHMLVRNCRIQWRDTTNDVDKGEEEEEGDEDCKAPILTRIGRKLHFDDTSARRSEKLKVEIRSRKQRPDADAPDEPMRSI